MTKHEKQTEEQKNVPAIQATGTALEVVDFGDDAGKGLENITAAELTIPFFRILQPTSPQLKDPRQDAKGIPNAKMGMILDISTNEIFDGVDGIPFIPSHRDRNFIEWTPRLAGGGFVKIYQPDDPLVVDLQSKFGKFGKLPRNVTKRDPATGEALDGTEIIETCYLYGLGTTSYTPMLFVMTSTQVKKYKNFVKRALSLEYANPRSTPDNVLPPVIPPLFAHRWLLQTVPEKNAKGDYFGWRLTLAEKNADGSEAPYIKSLVKRSDPLYQKASKFYDDINAGKAKVDITKSREPGEDLDEVPM